MFTWGVWRGRFCIVIASCSRFVCMLVCLSKPRRNMQIRLSSPRQIVFRCEPNAIAYLMYVPTCTVMPFEYQANVTQESPINWRAALGKEKGGRRHLFSPTKPANGDIRHSLIHDLEVYHRPYISILFAWEHGRSGH